MRNLAAVFAVAAFAGISRATPIPILNYSFESPSAATPFGVSTAIDNWTTYGDVPFDTGGGAQSSGTGIFPNKNPDNTFNFTNADQKQLAYIFTRSSIATNRDGLEQVLSDKYVAGQSYTLSVDVGLAGANPDATDPFSFSLFYFDPANPTARTVVASRTIFNDANTALSKTLLTTVSFSTPLLSADALAIGKEIGVEIYTAQGSDVTATAGNEYDFDNVRLNQTPEPASLGMLSGAALLFLRRRRIG
ncbi:MAG TPA: PEP-CTERM sorting domain-containing protein [Tepidisphaeraceae bacterium]|nr:PEP-CTERM sorting domain-containing protein [Tepidisphaeraceae bacterium]